MSEDLRRPGPLTLEEKQAKSVLNRRKHVNDWLWDRYSVNPYEGCAQACEYCDAVSHRYHRHADFHRTVYVKVNAPEVLRRQIARRQPDVVVLSGVTEPYPSAETRYRITRRCLEVLLERRFPVHVVTKSPLVLQDLDLLQELHRESAVRISVTIPTLREELSRALEPRSPSARKRLEAVRALTSAGLPAGVLMIPVIPLLLDDEEHLEEVIGASKESGAGYVLFGGLTLRDRQEERWFAFLEDRFPDLEQPFRNLPEGRWPNVARAASALCRKHGIADRIPRPVPDDDPARWNKLVAERLYRRCHELQLEDASSRRIWAWRKAAWSLDDLEEDVRILRAEGRLRGIPGVGRSLAQAIEDALDGLED